MSFKDKVGAAWDPASETIDVEGVPVLVRSMSALGRTRLLKGASEDGIIDVEKWFPYLVLTCCFDPETDEKAFTEEDLDWLGARASGPIEVLATAALRVSGMAKGSVDEGKGDS